MYFNQKCEKPGCERDAEKTYSGAGGNSLRLCEEHYYRLVASDSPSLGTGIGDSFTNTSDPWGGGDESVIDNTYPTQG